MIGVGEGVSSRGPAPTEGYEPTYDWVTQFEDETGCEVT